MIPVGIFYIWLTNVLFRFVIFVFFFLQAINFLYMTTRRIIRRNANTILNDIGSFQEVFLWISFEEKRRRLRWGPFVDISNESEIKIDTIDCTRKEQQKNRQALMLVKLKNHSSFFNCMFARKSLSFDNSISSQRCEEMLLVLFFGSAKVFKDINNIFNSIKWKFWWCHGIKTLY